MWALEKGQRSSEAERGWELTPQVTSCLPTFTLDGPMPRDFTSPPRWPEVERRKTGPQGWIPG